MSLAVDNPILNNPFEEPGEYCNMNYANSKKGIILNGLKQSRIVGRKENYTHEKEFIKEVKKSH